MVRFSQFRAMLLAVVLGFGLAGLSGCGGTVVSTKATDKKDKDGAMMKDKDGAMMKDKDGMMMKDKDGMMMKDKGEMKMDDKMKDKAK